MQDYLMLFALAGVWIFWASVYDLKTREVPNWLTFSLIAGALAYRCFFALEKGESGFFWWGVVGLLVFVVIAHLFYYGKIFAGGDAKLLMGTGVALPYANGEMLLYWGIAFVLFLMFAGAVYSIFYSVFLAIPRWGKLKKIWRMELIEAKLVWLVCAVLFMGSIFLQPGKLILIGGSIFLLILPILYSYLRAIERVCMIRNVRVKDLLEGDWLARDVRVGKKVISASIHGLTQSEIELLRKLKKKVFIRDGVPFVPAFLFAYALMVYAFASESLDFAALVSA